MIAIHRVLFRVEPEISGIKGNLTPFANGVQHIERRMKVRAMPKPYSVPSADRSLQRLGLLAQYGCGLSLSNICRRLALPKGATHLSFMTLEMRGYF